MTDLHFDQTSTGLKPFGAEENRSMPAIPHWSAPSLTVRDFISSEESILTIEEWNFHDIYTKILDKRNKLK